MRAYILIFTLFAASVSFAQSREDYHSPLIQIGASYHAKHMCTCLFVSGQGEEFCKRLSKTKPDFARYKINYKEKSVFVRFALKNAMAKLESLKHGCRVVKISGMSSSQN